MASLGVSAKSDSASLELMCWYSLRNYLISQWHLEDIEYLQEITESTLITMW
jgi:hypothetical protein